ncbi:RNA polymerase, alpha chain C terminal domain [Geodermatophilus amargosae]|uniref:RNA polymerase, alpha chain C terminal domain n=1 Tax=Geodermatophilus amargosae TaxID=1296565 RepID=A0A1I6YJU1_9ACTN|nr:DNA-directed RNA polymerase subunit alpha C-terminal domain-containing protein [Geodermatophilus amargosae]SFT50491.1 RNA polymerase, alpha chain C terminal domain [Geodermatophilus amargosae]
MPTGTVQELGLPVRAVGALARAGITTVDELAALTRRELSAVPGLGPAMVAAIRAVVPEPVAKGVWPLPDDGDDGGPASPAIPSFESLRGPRRRSALDLLVPEQPPEEDAKPAEEDTAVLAEEDTAQDAEPLDDLVREQPPERSRAPRPAEWSDLAALGVRGVRAAASLHWRVTVWWVQAPARLVERLRARS